MMNFCDVMWCDVMDVHLLILSVFDSIVFIDVRSVLVAGDCWDHEKDWQESSCGREREPVGEENSLVTSGRLFKQ